ncbi:leptin receptor gene-related protein [Lingula anatina]|uniref:Leptin receptor gene-related protein n=1 Tax=Lingula anatina TaxID=7574 RepID=A0A1S3IM06_LINAN|nr:leptin receptor gene-related protein [Lingula anatina]|eukprot:XP_013398564.1 leptin receptor gene-related protein [Lingula anatina]
MTSLSHGRNKRLVALAFAAAIGITLLVLGCALPEYNNWWPMFVLMFYALSPLPTVVARRYADSLESSSAFVEMCIFLTTGIVVSAFGLPIILAHTSIIQWAACGLVMSGNAVVFLTILGYFWVFGNDDFDYGNW